MAKVLLPASGPEDWRNFLAKAEHWSTGHSAKALAYCWHEAGGFPKEVEAAFHGHPDFELLEPLLLLPEHKVPLPGGVTASQNDIWVLARTGEELVSIAVEGKVGEDFGPTIGEWKKNASVGKQERMAYLLDVLNLSSSFPDDIRYQLVHRTASALIEARRFHAKSAVMLVHSFSPSDDHFGDYSRFLAFLGLSAEINTIGKAAPTPGVNLYLGWVRGDEKYLRV